MDIKTKLSYERICNCKLSQSKTRNSKLTNAYDANTELINKTKKNGGRIIAVGTTSVRVLETAAERSQVKACTGRTNLFIKPSYEFKMVDAMVTNFHLPRSTLLALVAAFAGLEKVLAAYEHAVKKQYRFYSYGDAMLIL